MSFVDVGRFPTAPRTARTGGSRVRILGNLHRLPDRVHALGLNEHSRCVDIARGADSIVQLHVVIAFSSRLAHGSLQPLIK